MLRKQNPVANCHSEAVRYVPANKLCFELAYVSDGLPDIDESQFAALLEKARAGDDVSRERLFALSRPFLSHCAEKEISSWLRPKHDASDLVQVSMLEAHRAFTAFQGTDFRQWQAFLRKILERNATDAVRHFGTAKRQVGKEVALYPQSPDASSMDSPNLAGSDESPSVEAVRHERSAHLMQAVEKLPPDYQEVIRLRNLEQLPFDEVAQRMKRSRPAVQMLWMRALKSLEVILRDDQSTTTGS